MSKIGTETSKYKVLEKTAKQQNKGPIVLNRRADELDKLESERKRAEKELRESEERYRSLVKNVSLGVFRSTPSKHGEFIEVNPAMEYITGYSRDELLKMHISQLYDKPVGRERFIERAAGVKGKIAQEISFRRKDGKRIIVSDTKTSVRDKNGKIMYFDGILEDITERKLAEEQLRQSEERLKIYLESAPDGVYITDLKGTFLYGNKKAEEIIGYKREELINQSFLKADLLRKGYFRKAIALLGLNAMGKSTGPDEFKLKRKDKKSVWVEINTTPIKQNGETIVVGFVRDITERKRVEEELKESEERYRALYEGTYDIVQSVDKNGKFLYVNPSWLRTLGYTREELPKIKLYDILHSKSIDYCNKMYKKIIDGKSVHDLRAIFVTKEGRAVQVEGSAVPYIVDGKVVATQGFFHDVTERKKMEEHLMVADRLASIGKLASGVAHELNNPLTGVIGFSELLMEKDVDNEVKEDIAIIHHEAVRAAEVVKNLLTFARKHAPLRQPTNINSIIASVLGLRAYEYKVNNIKIITSFASNLPMIIADSFQLQQVILNIIINAEYAMDEAHKGGILKITTEREGNNINISFADNGTGISEKNMKHLFDPFFTTKGVGRGTGLGLSICHGIVTEHGGRVYARSELGKGTTFIVELPVNTNGTEYKETK